MKNADMPAMPVERFYDEVGNDMCTGLTKRELFAAMAMQGILASNMDGHPEEFSDWAVLNADTLLKELEDG